MEFDWHARYVQQAHWTSEVRRYLFQHLPKKLGLQILEVGSGTGAVLECLAKEIPHLQPAFTGLDISADYLTEAHSRLSGIDWIQGDAHHLPLPGAAFDIAYCHFLLLWVANPRRAVSEMRRVVRPGGWVFAIAEPDYTGRIDYPPELAELGNLQVQALHAQGADTGIGRKLCALMGQAGLQSIEAGVIGGQWQTPQSPEYIDHEWQVLRRDLGDRLSQGELDRLEQIDRQAWARGERVLFVPTFYACGQVSPSTDQSG